MLKLYRKELRAKFKNFLLQKFYTLVFMFLVINQTFRLPSGLKAVKNGYAVKEIG